MPTNDPQKIQTIIRNLEGVLKTTRDDTQKRRVYKEIQHWKKELEMSSNALIDLENEEYEKSAPGNHSENSHIDPLEEFEILKLIKIIQFNHKLNNRELDEIYTFVKYFEDEYLGMLGEYHIKLDYNIAHVREGFYTKVHDIHLAIKNYAESLLRIDNNTFDSSQKSRQKMDAQVEYRNLISKVGEFFKKLYQFIDNLIEDNQNGGNLVSNPHHKLKFDSKLDVSQVLQGCTVIEGLKDLHHFLSEIMNYLNLPDLKKDES